MPLSTRLVLKLHGSRSERAHGEEPAVRSSKDEAAVSTSVAAGALANGRKQRDCQSQWECSSSDAVPTMRSADGEDGAAVVARTIAGQKEAAVGSDCSFVEPCEDVLAKRSAAGGKKSVQKGVSRAAVVECAWLAEQMTIHR